MPIKVDIATNTDLHNFPPLRRIELLTGHIISDEIW